MGVSMSCIKEVKFPASFEFITFIASHDIFSESFPNSQNRGPFPSLHSQQGLPEFLIILQTHNSF